MTSLGFPVLCCFRLKRGLLVSELMTSAQARKHVKDSPASRLFVAAPPAKDGSSRYTGKEVALVDTTVYTRNRCFRLLFHSKYGKNASLQLTVPLLSMSRTAPHRMQWMGELQIWNPANVLGTGAPFKGTCPPPVPLYSFSHTHTHSHPNAALTHNNQCALKHHNM